MAINLNQIPFNRFPADFHYVELNTHKQLPPKIMRYTRARYVDGDLWVWREKNGEIELAYHETIPEELFVVLDPRTVKWRDPATERQFTLAKSGGCACKWNKLSLNHITPEIPA